MRCSPVRVISLKTRQPVTTSEDQRAQRHPVPPQGEAALDVECVRQGNFCLCWMPAWFYFAERVGEERRKTDV